MPKRGPDCLTILPTYRCTAACSNCCFGSHPWVEGRIPQSEILRYIREAAQFQTLSLVVFSGGECFLLEEDLIEAVALATRLGLATRCVTNGFWATSERTAMRKLEPLLDAGLSEINFSTGDNHSEYVSLDNILYGSYAAKKLGIGIAVMIELTDTRKVTRETLLQHPLHQKFFGTNRELNEFIVESPWIAMDEAATNVQYDPAHYLNKNNVHTKSGCNSILSTIVATPQRELFSCCGITSQQIPEVKLGSLDQHSILDMYEDASNDFIKMWLSVDGPEKIVAWASQFDSSIEWENRFAHQCETCQFMFHDAKVKKVVREHYKDVIHDVLLKYSMLRPSVPS
ncbi:MULTISPECIES: radical SAM protein [unclassified Deinococcus]|uniref:radical SAM protein n=1 Tax=unclassified Deinococcus TaxID=2623546 RepID=UPI001E5CCA30|nr:MULTISPECIES: radical SAM protein [unclassified Deinococcus]MCD0158218.1 radical SAM protein [Deinococcus sp. 6GRE01]MCD0160218.1 radical SAM protein [Deinococcus sp. 6YEL10]